MAESFKMFGLLGDRGWIIEKLAADIAAVDPRFEFDLRLTGRPDLVYYMTYAARKKPFEGLEVGYFTHIEEGLPAEQRFYDIAQEVDFCVTQAQLYEDILTGKGVRNIQTIPPGINHDEFFPRLRVGVVGRTYHTGRKGESVIAPLMNLDSVEFLFTGEGWPGPPLHIPEGAMGAFYRSLDYLLVPALYEGGPMSVPEALACGVPVIAPSDVGWVKDFPHIPYIKGDSADLRRVLQGCFEKKQELAQAAQAYTSRRWGEAHITLFDQLLHGQDKGTVWHYLPKLTKGTAKKEPLKQARIQQVMHGGERHSKGGPSVRVPYTAERLAPFCVQSDVSFGGVDEIVDIAHFYNIWQPDTALQLAKRLRPRAAQLVFSPILLDLSLRDFWEQVMLQEMSRQPEGPRRFEHALPYLTRGLERASEQREMRIKGFQPVPGFAARLRAISAISDKLVFLSQFERHLAQDFGVDCGRSSILHNPVDCDFFTPECSEQDVPLRDRVLQQLGLSVDTPFLLNVGRIEVRKNQLALADLARRLDMPLILVGHEGSVAYANLVREVGGTQLRFAGRFKPRSPELRALYQSCAAFASFSWAEGASLAVLEAAACGAPLLLADTSSEREYFEGLAHFCGPLDLEAAEALMPSVISDGDPVARHRRHVAVSKRFDWTQHIENLSKIYGALLHKGRLF